MEYLRLEPESALPDWPFTSPYQAVLVIEEKVSADWQEQVSEWLVQSGCLYMMAWGLECSTWDDSVDMANMKEFNFEEIPESKFVMTTWHENEPLNEVFWFSKNTVVHPDLGELHPVIVHISTENKRTSLLAEYENA
ncbi:MAG: hypothetical protein ABW116_14175 [Candidatus Sedimenticola sp. 20ELBAFRAG]